MGVAAFWQKSQSLSGLHSETVDVEKYQKQLWWPFSSNDSSRIWVSKRDIPPNTTASATYRYGPLYLRPKLTDYHSTRMLLMFNELTSHPPQKHSRTLSAEAPCIPRVHQHVYLEISELGFLKKGLQSLYKREGSQTILLCHPALCCQKLLPNAHHQKQFVTVYLGEGWPSVWQWTPAMSESAQIWGNIRNWQSLHCPQHVPGWGAGVVLRTSYLSSRSAVLCLGAQHTQGLHLGSSGWTHSWEQQEEWGERRVKWGGEGGGDLFWLMTDWCHGQGSPIHTLLVPRCGDASQVSDWHQPFCYQSEVALWCLPYFLSTSVGSSPYEFSSYDPRWMQPTPGCCCCAVPSQNIHNTCTKKGITRAWRGTRLVWESLKEEKGTDGLSLYWTIKKSFRDLTILSMLLQHSKGEEVSGRWGGAKGHSGQSPCAGPCAGTVTPSTLECAVLPWKAHIFFFLACKIGVVN